MATATLAAPSAPQTNLVTAEVFVEHYSHRYAELIDGILVENDMPSGRHGQICSKADRLIGNFAEQHQLGHTLSNDTSVLIRRDPDTVRGPDVCFIGFDRIPPGPLAEGLIQAVPQLVVEVRSPSNTWTDIFGKIGDYLKRGVTAVLVLDSDRLTASVYRGTNGQEIFHVNDTLTLPDILPGFSVPVLKFFE